MPMPNHLRKQDHLQALFGIIMPLGTQLSATLNEEDRQLALSLQAGVIDLVKGMKAPHLNRETLDLDEEWSDKTIDLARRTADLVNRELERLKTREGNHRFRISLYEEMYYRLRQLQRGPVWEKEEMTPAMTLAQSATICMLFPDTEEGWAALEEADQSVPMSRIFQLGVESQRIHDNYREAREKGELTPELDQMARRHVLELDDQTLALAKNLKDLEQSPETSPIMERFFQNPEYLHARTQFAGDRGLLDVPAKILDVHGDILRTTLPRGEHFRALNEAFEDLLTVQSIDKHRDTRAFTAVTDAIRALQTLTEPYFMLNAPLIREQLRTIADAYQTLQRACDDYLQGKGTSRSSGIGQGRLNSVRAIRDLVNKDLIQLEDSLALPKNAPFPTLEEIVARGRTSQVQVTAPQELENQTDMISSRVPLHVESETAARDVFFTEQTKLLDQKQMVAAFRESIADRPGMERMASLMQDKGWTALQELGRVRVIAREHTMLMEGEWKGFKFMTPEHQAELFARDENVEEFDEIFHDFIEVYDRKFGEGSFTNDFDTEEKKQELFLLAVQALKYFAQEQVFHGKLEIKNGEEIGKRNIATSRVAGVLGIGHVYAHSEPMEIEVGGVRKKGCAMDRAKGSHLDQIEYVDMDQYMFQGIPDDAPVDPLQGLTKGDMNRSGQFKRDAADIQVGDYILGSFDRHEANMTYDLAWKDKSRMEVDARGIQAIDNDACMGTAKDDLLEGIGCIMPHNMVVMRLSTAERVLKTTPQMLRFQLSDLQFTEDELKAMESRLQKLQKKLREDMKHFENLDPVNDLTLEPGRIRVLKDEAFDKPALTVQNIARCVTDGKKTVFTRMYGLQDTVSRKCEVRLELKEQNVPMKSHEIHYAPAKQLVREEPQRRGPIQTARLNQELENLKASFTAMAGAYHWWHRDSGDFKWMRDAVYSAVKKIKEICDRHLDDRGYLTGQLTEAEAKELDQQYRNIANAAKNYLKTHPDPSRGIGTARRDVAMNLASVRTPREVVNPPVVQMNFQQAQAAIAGQQGQAVQGRQRAHSAHVRGNAPVQPANAPARDDTAVNNNRPILPNH